MPGLVEGHSHVAEGVQWRFVYCGYFDRTDPGGKVWTGVKSIDEVVARLSVANAKLYDSKQPLTGWSLDPIYFDNRRMTRQHLDQISDARPIAVMHASMHIMNVNTRALELAGLLRKGINHPGIPLGDDGLPTGEIKGPDAMTPLGPHVGLDRALLASDEPGLRDFARLCVRKGVTTAADLANLLPQPAVEMMLRVTGEQQFPARIVSLRVAREVSPAELVERVVELAKLSTDRLRLGMIKIVVDGSIQGFSARLRAPGYYNGAPNGLWYIAPEQLREIFRTRAGRRRPGSQSHQWRRGHRAGARYAHASVAQKPLARSSLHAATLPACQRRAIPPHESARHVRESVPQSSFLLGRPALCPDRRPGTRRAHERLRHGAGQRRALGDPFRRAGDAAGAAVHRLVRGQSPDRQRPHSRDRGAHLGRAMPCAPSRSARPTRSASTARSARSKSASPPISPCSRTIRPRSAATSFADVRIWGTVQGGRIFAAATI